MFTPLPLVAPQPLSTPPPLFSEQIKPPHIADRCVTLIDFLDRRGRRFVVSYLVTDEGCYDHLYHCACGRLLRPDQLDLTVEIQTGIEMMVHVLHGGR